jgi:hypothetical protein
MSTDRPDVSGKPVGVFDEKGLESTDYAVNCLDDFDKIGIDRIGATWWSKDSPFKRYIEDGLYIHFHFGLWSPNRESNFGDYCALVQSAIKIQNSLAGLVIQPRSGHLKSGSVGHGLGHCEELMFISGVQFLKEPERVFFTGLSQIRLAVSDFDKCILVDELIEAHRFDPIFESSQADADRKEGSSVLEVAARQPPSNIIERGACIVHTVPDNGCPLCLRNRFSDLQLEQIFRLFTIIFTDKGIGLRVKKSLHFSVKRTAMYFSSLDFEPTFT